MGVQELEEKACKTAFLWSKDAAISLCMCALCRAELKCPAFEGFMGGAVKDSTPRAEVSKSEGV